MTFKIAKRMGATNRFFAKQKQCFQPTYHKNPLFLQLLPCPVLNFLLEFLLFARDISTIMSCHF